MVPVRPQLPVLNKSLERDLSNELGEGDWVLWASEGCCFRRGGAGWIVGWWRSASGRMACRLEVCSNRWGLCLIWWGEWSLNGYPFMDSELQQTDAVRTR